MLQFNLNMEFRNEHGTEVNIHKNEKGEWFISKDLYGHEAPRHLEEYAKNGNPTNMEREAISQFLKMVSC